MLRPALPVSFLAMPKQFLTMDPSEILELVKDGTIEPDEVEAFEALDEEVQQLVADGDLDMNDAAGL